MMGDDCWVTIFTDNGLSTVIVPRPADLTEAAWDAYSDGVAAGVAGTLNALDLDDDSICEQLT